VGQGLLTLAAQGTPGVSQQVATLIAALITGTIALTVGILAYIFGRMQKEHEVQFSRVHEQRAKIVADLYKVLYDIQKGIDKWKQYTLMEGAKVAEQRKTFLAIAKLIDKFADCYCKEDFWISDGTRRKLDGFYGRASDIWNESAIDNPEADEEIIDARRSELDDLRRILKAEFREVLGISDSQGTTGGGGKMQIYPGGVRLAFGLLGPTLIGFGFDPLSRTDHS
jgi:hypothetical protein